MPGWRMRGHNFLMTIRLPGVTKLIQGRAVTEGRCGTNSRKIAVPIDSAIVSEPAITLGIALGSAAVYSVNDTCTFRPDDGQTSAALSQAKNEVDRLVCANIFGLPIHRVAQIGHGSPRWTSEIQRRGFSNLRIAGR